MGVVFFAVYYLLFRWVIVKWNMRTPGREPEAEFEAEQAANLTDEPVLVLAGSVGGPGSAAAPARRAPRPAPSRPGTPRPSSSSRPSAGGRTS